jgi:hypothetical protein
MQKKIIGNPNQSDSYKTKQDMDDLLNYGSRTYSPLGNTNEGNSQKRRLPGAP